MGVVSLDRWRQIGIWSFRQTLDMKAPPENNWPPTQMWLHKVSTSNAINACSIYWWTDNDRLTAEEKNRFASIDWEAIVIQLQITFNAWFGLIPNVFSIDAKNAFTAFHYAPSGRQPIRSRARKGEKVNDL